MLCGVYDKFQRENHNVDAKGSGSRPCHLERRSKHLSTNSPDVLVCPGRDVAPYDGMLGSHVAKTTNNELAGFFQSHKVIRLG